MFVSWGTHIRRSFSGDIFMSGLKVENTFFSVETTSLWSDTELRHMVQLIEENL